MTVVASRNTSGIVCWLMIQITIVKASSWTGFCSHHVVSVGVILCLVEITTKITTTTIITITTIITNTTTTITTTDDPSLS